MATTSAPSLDNYTMVISPRSRLSLANHALIVIACYQYVGNDSIYAFTFKHEKNPECPVCGGETVDLKVKKGTRVESFIEMLTENQRL